MFFKSLNNLKGSVWLMFFVLGPLLLIGAGKTNGDTSSTNNSPASMHSPAAGNSAADDLPDKINEVVKKEFENEFGPLKSQIKYDKKEMWGRVISIDYQLPKDKRLDDTWGDKVVKALGRLGITAEYNGKSEVRAEQQKIADETAASIQVTSQRRHEEDQDAIGFTTLIMNK